MHQTAFETGAQFFRVYCESKPGGRVVDIGSLDVNGSLRDGCPARFEYVGLDFAPGKGVDIVLEDPYVLPLASESADVVVCSSCFEHSEMFWLVFLEALRILKPDGLLYLNVPSNGLYHRYPVDCWRFYPDSGEALATWARRSGFPTVMLESFISRRKNDSWNDCVAIFLKDGRFAEDFTARICDPDAPAYNRRVLGSEEIEAFQEVSEDQQILADVYVELGQRDAKLEKLQQELAGLSAQVGQSHEQRVKSDRPLAEAQRAYREQLGRLKAESSALREEVASLREALDERESRVSGLDHGLQQVHRQLQSVHASISWRVTAPLRVAGRLFQLCLAVLGLVYYKTKRECYRWASNVPKRDHYTRRVWEFKEKVRALRTDSARQGSIRVSLLHPVSWRLQGFSRRAVRLARHVYLVFKVADYKLKRETHRLLNDKPKVARYSNKLLHYRAKLHQLRHGITKAATASWQTPTIPVTANVEFVPRLDRPLQAVPSARAICFYLPQFHPIPENDEWWGKGFTEWTNVRPARPQFSGHHQPHEAGDLGYYDLLDSDTQRRQVELAKLYGIHGFCFYFYWFHGKRLLEAPVLNYLNDPTLDLPFCLCWANENWSRRWDGKEAHILIGQEHSPEDDLAFISYLARYLRDDRYIRVQDRPLVLVYRPELLPSAPQTAHRWRQWCRENGIGEIYLAYTQSFEKVDPAQYGFDAAIEFPPNRCNLPVVTSSVVPLRGDFDCAVYDWRELVVRSQHYEDPGYKLFRGVCPAWDNTARRKNRGTVLLNSSPEHYRQWLCNAVRDTELRHADPSERLVFVNAWNEWAEGAHLEPDQRYGYAYLEATRDALGEESAILFVTHDCHPHGAQFLSLEIARRLKANGSKVYLIALDGGVLFDDFAQVGTIINARAVSDEQLDRFLAGLQDRGIDSAITSTVVSGQILPRLKQFGFRVLSLIHELPGVIRDMGQEGNARLVAEFADKVVFPARLVGDQFGAFAEVPADRTVIRPQGVLRRNPFQGRRADAHRLICEKFRLPLDAKIGLAIGYLDERKGADLFVEVAAKVLTTQPKAYFIWVGHAEQKMYAQVVAALEQRGIADRVLLAGFDRDPMAFYAAASVYLLTSREDPFPNVVLEAAEAGTPVVAFEGATGAADFVVKHAGRLARAFDTSEFAQRVAELMEQPARLDVARVGSLQQYVLDLLFHLRGQPRVSVVLPNYNYAKYLPGRLDSICLQGFPVYELIVLDDASSDESVDVCEEYLRRSSVDYHIVRNPENSGSVFRQWVKGVSMCSGDLVWIAEADDQAHRGFLKALVPAFADAGVVLAYTQSKQMGAADEILATDYFAYTQDVCEHRWRQDYVCDGPREIAEAFSVKNTLPNVSAALFRRSALEATLAQIGERLFDYRIAGDWMVYLHLLCRGKIHFCATALNLHRRHSRGVTNSSDAQLHLREVHRMQELAAELSVVPEPVQRKVQEYNAHLLQHFKLGPEAPAQAA